MNRIIFILTFSAFMFSQQAEVTNIQAAQRTDGSQIVEITYDITPDAIFTYFNVSGEVSMDGGGSYEDMQFATGDIGIGITAGTGRAIVWGFGQQFNETYSNQVKIKINAISTAIIAGDSLEVPFEMITIPAGDYTYGENDAVQTIAYDYDMMKYDVTDFDYVNYLITNTTEGSGNTCVDLTNLDGSPWNELGGIQDGEEYWNCDWYVSAECPDYGDEWNNDAGYNGMEACCDCGGGMNVAIFIHPDGIYGNYPGDAQYPTGEYLFLDFSQSKISYNGEIFEVEEGYVDHPVTGVTWFGAWHFATHYGLQLPSQYEWEKAARGTTGYDYPWGDEISNANANYILDLSSTGIYVPSVWWGGYVTFSNPMTSFNGTTPVGFFNGVNDFALIDYSEAIDYIIYVEETEDGSLGGEYVDESGTFYDVPFTIEENCTDINIGLWDSYGVSSVYYQLTYLIDQQILASGSVESPGCSLYGQDLGEEIFQCLDFDIECGEQNNPCNTNIWYLIEVTCLQQGEYNLIIGSDMASSQGWLGDLIAFIDIDPGNVEDYYDPSLTIDSPSPYGLYDMAGNVSQWLNKFPISSTSGIKGGNWGDTEGNLLSWNNIQQDPITASNQMGFRCIKPISVNLNRNPREMLEEHKKRHRQSPVHPNDRNIDGP